MSPLVRVGNTVYGRDELEIGRFEPLADVAGELYDIGILHLDTLSESDPGGLADALGYELEEAENLVNTSKLLLSELAAGHEG